MQGLQVSLNSRNANNSMILNTAGKSATAGRQVHARTSGVVDTGEKFTTGVADTETAYSSEYLPPGVSELEEKF
jgi:hypothetical protein